MCFSTAVIAVSVKPCIVRVHTDLEIGKVMVNDFRLEKSWNRDLSTFIMEKSWNFYKYQ